MHAKACKSVNLCFETGHRCSKMKVLVSSLNLRTGVSYCAMWLCLVLDARMKGMFDDALAFLGHVVEGAQSSFAVCGARQVWSVV